jgi:hypothetical protein
MDKTALLMEMNEILGYKDVADKMEAATPTPAAIAATFQQPGNTLVDDAVLESLSRLEWNEVFQIAAFGMYPPEAVIGLNRALWEGTASFRAAWSGFAREFEVPEDLGRGSFLMMNKISRDDNVITRLVSWSAKMVDEADSRVKTRLTKENPRLAEAVFSPAGNAKKAAKEKADTERYMLPHRPATDRPTSRAKVMTTRMFQDAKKVQAAQKRDLKAVEKEIQKLAKLAKKAGSTPEEMFPMLYRDLMRERARHS